MDFDGVPTTLSIMYLSFGTFSAEADMRWHVADTVRRPLRAREKAGWSALPGLRLVRAYGASRAALCLCRCLRPMLAIRVRQAAVKRRADALLVGFMDLPQGTQITVESCATG